MSSKKGGFVEIMFKSIMPKVYGIGAAIVIIGAMFKILHFEGAAIMLGVGLSVEAIIFFLSAFEPPHKEIDWTKVYPELDDDFDDDYAPLDKTPTKKAVGDGTTQQLDALMASANIGPELIKSLGDGMSKLSESAKQLGTLGTAATATNEYAKNVQEASKSLVEMNKTYATTVKVMNEMADASRDAKEYHSQVQAVTKNLGALNSVYELELQDANKHVKNMNKFYDSLGSAIQSITDSAKDTEQFKVEVNKLTTNLSSLNNIYGNMLSAMKN